MAAIQAAGVKQIDHLLLTHYHGDHVGGLQELATRIPIAHFIDHGASSEPREQVPGFQKMYAEMNGKVKHTVVVPGDTIPFAGLTVTVVTSHGQVLKTPLPGGGWPNRQLGESNCPNLAILRGMLLEGAWLEADHVATRLRLETDLAL